MTQKDRVKRMLRRGPVTSGQCVDISPPILRLASIINRLREDGWRINTVPIDPVSNYSKYVLISEPVEVAA